MGLAVGPNHMVCRTQNNTYVIGKPKTEFIIMLTVFFLEMMKIDN